MSQVFYLLKMILLIGIGLTAFLFVFNFLTSDLKEGQNLGFQNISESDSLSMNNEFLIKLLDSSSVHNDRPQKTTFKEWQGFLSLKFDSFPSSPDIHPAYFNLFPKTFKYLIVLSIGISLLLIFAVYFLSVLRDLISILSGLFDKKSVLLYLIFVVPLLSFAFFLIYQFGGDNSYPIIGTKSALIRYGILFENPEYIYSLITRPFYILSLLPLFGFLLIIVITGKLNSNPSYKPLAQKKEDIHSLVTHSFNALAIGSSILVAFAVVAFSLSIESLNEHMPNAKIVLFPKEIFHIYGLLFSFILFLFLTPTFVAVKKLGSALSPKDSVLSSNAKPWWALEQYVKEMKLIGAILLPYISSYL